MFLDINMPHLSGLELLESLEKPPLTIITTAYSEYALDGFRLHVVDYLMKPIGFQRFFQAVSKARDLFLSQLVLRSEHDETHPVCMSGKEMLSNGLSGGIFSMPKECRTT